MASVPPETGGSQPHLPSTTYSQPSPPATTAAYQTDTNPPPIDYYAADRASQYFPKTTPPPPRELSIPIDFYVADRSPPPHPHLHQFHMAGPPPTQGGPPPYGQAPGGYWQQPAPQGTPIACLGSHPAPVVCPNCHHSGVTAVEYSSGGFTHALGALFCFVTCLGCIPYFFSGLKDATHKCTNCGVPLATYHRSGRTEPHLQG